MNFQCHCQSTQTRAIPLLKTEYRIFFSVSLKDHCVVQLNNNNYVIVLFKLMENILKFCLVYIVTEPEKITILKKIHLNQC